MLSDRKLQFTIPDIKMKQLVVLSLVLVTVTLTQCKSLDGSTNQLDSTGNQQSEKLTNIADSGNVHSDKYFLKHRGANLVNELFSFCLVNRQV